MQTYFARYIFVTGHTFRGPVKTMEISLCALVVYITGDPFGDVFMIIFTLSWRRSRSYRNQSLDLHNKSIDWFLSDRDLRHDHERVKLT